MPQPKTFYELFVSEATQLRLGYRDDWKETQEKLLCFLKCPKGIATTTLLCFVCKCPKGIAITTPYKLNYGRKILLT